MSLSDFITVGRKIKVYYHTGHKDLGEYEISAIYQATIQCKSLLTGNVLYFPNPLAPNLLVTSEIGGGTDTAYKVIDVMIYELTKDSRHIPVYTFRIEVNHAELMVQSKQGGSINGTRIIDTGTDLQLRD